MIVYYNEIDPFAAEWLRELIKSGHIAPGVVDTRSIEDVVPSDLIGFTQCHFFAGIGTWSYTLRQAGWPDSRSVWTGSCPCQPFSAAGKKAGFADERHLWPAFHHLIRICRPVTVFGEQVASKDGLDWLDLVQADLEGEGYACGAIDTCAAGFGAPHIRQRLYWVAHASICEGRARLCDLNAAPERRRVASDSSTVCGLEHALSAGLEGYSGNDDRKEGWQEPVGSTSPAGQPCGVADTTGQQKYKEQQRSTANETGRSADQPCGCGMADTGQHHGPTHGFWGAADWLFCRDGKWRAVEPGTFPLAHGTPNRVGRLRGYGGAIVAPQATAFIRAYMDEDFYLNKSGYADLCLA